MEIKSSDQLIELLLKRRKVKDKELFLNPPYYSVAERDPFQLADMSKAVERLKLAKDNQETVVIYGDYDIDGLTATALLVDALGRFGLNVKHYTPDRFEEGYGLNSGALTYIKEELNASVVVTVDCGTVSFDELEHADKINLDVIVTDHHQPHDTLPSAVAVINPHRADSDYPFRQFAGVGVAFKLVQALQTELDGLEKGQEKWLLDLVALGTVCDVVPLTDENRSLVYWGIKVLAQTKRPGLRALMLSARVNQSTVAAQDLGFRLGPRLNAAGRLTHAKRSLKLLITNQTSEATQLATELEQLNSERRQVQKQVLSEAAEQAKDHTEPVIVVAGEDWNEGVIGIVAARLLEMFEKPSFVFSVTGDKAKASARSYGDYSAVGAIRAAEEVVVSGGGHQAAGGCTIKTEDIDKFRQLVNDHYQSQELNQAQQREQLQPEADALISDFSLLTKDVLTALQALEPFGQANPEPLFEIQIADYQQRLVGSDKNHLKLQLSDSSGDRIGAIMFGRDQLIDQLASIIGKLNSSNYDPRGVEVIVEDYT